MSNPIRYETAKRVTIVNAVLNTVLALFKIIVGWLGHSFAFVNRWHPFFIGFNQRCVSTDCRKNWRACTQ